ncbi:MAG TPA: hypothetical protein VMG82_20810, partial [Candidatus Sulfotelmatobacter sp.]|nr:hypothetical protein [Candidatus Sulfotelmatobacter sp.]
AIWLGLRIQLYLPFKNALLLIPTTYLVSGWHKHSGELPRTTATLATHHLCREVRRAYAEWRLLILFNSKYRAAAGVILLMFCVFNDVI